MLESNFFNSTQSELIEPNSSLDKYSAPYNSSNQYAVSEHSLKAIYIFAKKSFLLIAQFASEIFAPMLVQLLNSCFDRTYSFFSPQRYLYILIIRKANFLLFSKTMFSIPNF